MKRIQEKVKDLIDVRSYEVLQDFLADPARTLSAYHFTDITSDLMAQWLDKVAGVDTGGGVACALAGYRGVGKSHFLATLGAVISHPELRIRISDAHVGASAERLKRRRHPVAYVRRGIYDSFLDELRAAIAKTFEIDVTPIESLDELLTLAAEKADGLPFVLIIDTAFERTSRVARDDGLILSEIAEIARRLNIFVAVALDDDISGADGANAAITQTYSIDFLDQEHLYRIVNSFIFLKHRQALSCLHEIYSDFRTQLPNFRWSEQRFVSLYPLHPIILEIAPYVRLYAPDFALLSFTAEAGKKIMGRPANSLIALDEVFDQVEDSLRRVEDLRDTFAVFDKLNSEVVGQIPLMERMRAKLILKGLTLLSLDGYGTTVSEISAAMLIFDNGEAENGRTAVRELLEIFVNAFPENISRTQEEGREVRYSLKIGGKENLTIALDEAIRDISGNVIPKILRRIARDRYPEWALSNDQEEAASDQIDLDVVWRGSVRKGRISWDLETDDSQVSAPSDPDRYDWEIIINPFNDRQAASDSSAGDVPRVFWQPAPLKKEEADSILRYFVLLTNAKLRQEYGEQWQVAGHAHNVNVEKIWERIFLFDAKFLVDGIEQAISEDVRSQGMLSELLGKMIAPLFEARFPNHPFFAKTLGMGQVSTLVNDFFGGSKQNTPEAQELAGLFAGPLGLVSDHDDVYVAETEENIISLPLSHEVLALIESDSSEDMVSLNAIGARLRQSPFGLMRESQYLILAALVAQRQIEFVTSKGDRINRRSLDLKIIWDDIVGIAKPAGYTYAGRRLVRWAQILTGSENIQSIDVPEDKQEIHTGLERWLSDWKKAAVLERFHDLPDEILNTRVWRYSTNAEKTFGAVVKTVSEVLAEAISLEEGLHRIADAFSDSEEAFHSCINDLVILEDFINSADKRREIWTYLAVCEMTDDRRIEAWRTRLIQVIDEIYFNPSEKLYDEMNDLWQSFHERFTEYFAVQHDDVMKSDLVREKFDQIRRSDEWWEFENLSALPLFSRRYWIEASRLSLKFREMNCRFEVRGLLKTHPFCICSFNLMHVAEWVQLPEALERQISEGRRYYRNSLVKMTDVLIPLIEQFAQNTADIDFQKAAADLLRSLKFNEEIPTLNTNQLIILQKLFSVLPPGTLEALDDGSNGKMRGQISGWMNDIPSEPVLLKM